MTEQNFTLFRTRFIFRHPKPALSIGGAFFSPLSNVVWLCTWGVMILTALIIRVVFKQEYNLERLRNDSIYTEFDWAYILLLIFGGVCQQGKGCNIFLNKFYDL